MDIHTNVFRCVLLLVIATETPAFFAMDPNVDLSSMPCFNKEDSLQGRKKSYGELLLSPFVHGDRDVKETARMIAPVFLKKCGLNIEVEHGFIQEKRLTRQLEIDSVRLGFVNIGTYFPAKEKVKSTSWTGWLLEESKKDDSHLSGEGEVACEVKDHFVELSRVRRMAYAYKQSSFYPQSWNIGRAGGRCSKKEIPSHPFLLRKSVTYHDAGCHAKKYGHVGVAYLLGDTLKLVVFKRAVLLEAACEIRSIPDS